MKKIWMILTLVWMVRGFFSLGEVTEFLNTLPENSAHTAKVFSNHTSPINNYTVIYSVEGI